MQNTELDFSGAPDRSGFRLQRFEVLNWGTFHRRVWVIEPQGRNSLLTGDIGSGKSTLVDAVTSLLVPHNRIVYNKAAGAEGRERSLYSYIRGEYKSEQDELTQTARAVALRGENSYSVLLAWFHNQDFAQGATLAQVFWLKQGQRNPERFFVYAEVPLNIAEHFSRFGSDILELKKRLRRTTGVQVLDQFKEYATRWRQRFGIQQEKALELFYQTVSMKSVGNLTEFVRSHMLEQSDVDARIEGLRRAFDNLNRAHQAVLRAKAQIERLRPLVGDGERYGELSAAIEEFTACRDALVAWFAEQRLELSARQIARLEQLLEAVKGGLARLRQEIDSLRLQADSLKAGIEDSGGSRLRAIDQDISRLEPERDRRRQEHRRYQEYSSALGLAESGSAAVFERNRSKVQRLLQELRRETERLDAEKTDLAVEMRGLKQQGEELEQELASLRGRESNLPRRQLETRRAMAEDLEIPADELPFVGELLQVDPDEARWEGAAERLLHNFGLSLLVPDQHYARVSRYVDRTQLHGRLVYYRTRAEEARVPTRGRDPRSLHRKLRIKPESPFYGWLEAWLAEHFNHVCCDDLDEFRRQPKALTLQGQQKSGGRRHEKDDRHDLHDRSRFVLGWSNRDKIRTLEQQRDGLARRVIGLADTRRQLAARLGALEGRRDNARDLLNIQRFDDIRWQDTAAEIQSLQEEKRQIEESSDTLKSLRTQLRIVQGAISRKEHKEREQGAEGGRLDERLSAARAERQAAQELAQTWTPQERERLRPRLQAIGVAALPGVKLTLVNLDKNQALLRQYLQTEIDRLARQRDRTRDRLIAAMQAYKTDYPAETQELDAAVQALGEFSAMLRELEAQGLPRHEARFREMLREETIQGVAMFQAQLDREQREIEDKVASINRSLAEIEYNPATFIRLLTDLTGDGEIRDFRQQVRQVLSGSLSDDELYTEEKFLQVKAIIDRFNGREGLIDQDRRWTRKVTDVRNWFNFSASERFREDQSEKEFYSDTAGKSGGQKEKLAYTILASALAYQFGLEWGGAHSRSFRFVVIDEAFGRGSDESTRYALELFKKLGLQLLIVTPLQKIHIIEDYIHAVHFVHNRGGHDSVIRNLTVEEYQAEKLQFQARAEGLA